jgi:hypothetical protein
MRMTAGALVVLAAAAAWSSRCAQIHLRSPVRLSSFRAPVPVLPASKALVKAVVACWVAGGDLGRWLWIVAVLRSGGEAIPTHAAGRSPAVPSGANPSSDFATPPKRRMSDASLLAWTVVAIVIALVVGFFVAVWSICSDPTEGC